VDVIFGPDGRNWTLDFHHEKLDGKIGSDCRAPIFWTTKLNLLLWFKVKDECFTLNKKDSIQEHEAANAKGKNSYRLPMPPCCEGGFPGLPLGSL
jgi:hypothetical protein